MGMADYYASKDAEPEQVYPIRVPSPLDKLKAQTRTLLDPMVREMISMTGGVESDYARGQRDMIRALLGVSEEELQRAIGRVERWQRRTRASSETRSDAHVR